ncbi:MAG: hypothetical protein ACXAC7_06065 [Candidatus Hodarchaeales archaeon]|jgi:hypothetical protein
MALEVRVKLLEGPGLEDIYNIESTLIGNVENGGLELYRKGADLPYANYPWQTIKEVDGNVRGTITKKKLLFISFENETVLDLEVLDKQNIREIVADVIAFKTAAEQKNPKGGMERAVESLHKAKAAIGDAIVQAKGVALGKISSAKSGFKGGMDKLKDKKDKKHK